MLRTPIVQLAALAVLVSATTAFAQSGEFTKDDCIKDLMRNPRVTLAVPDEARGTTTLRTIDLDNDGKISLEEARQACSGAPSPSQ